jgi:hypothetical protein
VVGIDDLQRACELRAILQEEVEEGIALIVAAADVRGIATLSAADPALVRGRKCEFHGLPFLLRTRHKISSTTTLVASAVIAVASATTAVVATCT